MTELDKVQLMCELFGWENPDAHTLFHALTLLRKARGEAVASFDDFCVTLKVSQQ